jgi:hypothetical protein
MAKIHPSRMGLIPQDMRSTHIERPRRRSRSPRRSRRSPSPPTRPSRSGTATEVVIGPEQGILTTIGRGPVAGTALVMGTEGRQIEDKALDTTIIGDLYALHWSPLRHGGNQKICIRVEGIKYAMGDRHIVEVLIFWKGTE